MLDLIFAKCCDSPSFCPRICPEVGQVEAADLQAFIQNGLLELLVLKHGLCLGPRAFVEVEGRGLI